MADTEEGGPTELGPETAARPQSESGTETATFGMGCFWGPDARFGVMPGVVRTRVGYAGGTTDDPRYYSLGDHTEVVQVEYDPDVLTYGALLDVFWADHSPTSSVKRQYRSVVLAHDETQREVAEQSLADIEETTGLSVTTEVETLDGFTRAEDYHQKYELRSTPVVGDELVEMYGDAFVDSTVTARLNGFVAGHGKEAQRRAFLSELSLPPVVLSEVRRRLGL